MGKWLVPIEENSNFWSYIFHALMNEWLWWILWMRGCLRHWASHLNDSRPSLRNHAAHRCSAKNEPISAISSEAGEEKTSDPSYGLRQAFLRSISLSCIHGVVMWWLSGKYANIRQSTKSLLGQRKRSNDIQFFFANPARQCIISILHHQHRSK